MYRLTCAECSFETTAADVETAYDVFEEHADECGTSHFVNIEKIRDE